MPQDAQDTNKLSRVTDEMLQNFSDKQKEEEPETSTSETEDIVIEEPTSEDTTVVEFKEDETETPSKPKKERKPFFGLKICLTIVLICLLVAAIFGAWNRWFRYDDEEQLISNWQVNGSNAVVVIDGKKFTLNSNAVLEYTVDPVAKVLNYKTGDKSGQSHYRFSWDRNQVAIVENVPCDAISTMLSDIAWFWDWATCGMSHIDLSPAYTKNNKNDVDTENTGIDDIMNNGKTESILLDRIPTKKSETNK